MGVFLIGFFVLKIQYTEEGKMAEKAKIMNMDLLTVILNVN